MPAFAVALDVPCVIIENVRSIKNASENVVPISRRIFEKNGYFVDEIILEGTDFGVAQTRSRHFLVATKHQKLELDILVSRLKSDPLTFDDVNSQLPKIDCYPQLLETPTELSKDNQKISIIYTRPKVLTYKMICDQIVTKMVTRIPLSMVA